MSEHDLTLEELSERTGVEARTLRSWVSEGLLSPPLKAGRGARYPASNADRALAVRALKDIHGLSMSDIGRHFLMATEDQIRDWAAEAQPSLAPRGTARDYLSRIRSETSAAEPAQRSLDFRTGKAPSRGPMLPEPGGWPSKALLPTSPMLRRKEDAADLAGIERLILLIERALEAPAPRRARGTVWTRIAITPDLELSVRGDLAPRERVLFEQLADQFRAVLSRSSKND